jgi:Protein kinase domain
MSCLSDEQLASILTGKPAEAENAVWTEHLDRCAECQSRLEQLAGGTDWLPEWDGNSPSRLDEPSLDRYRAMTQSENGDTFVGKVAAGPGDALGDASLSAFLRPSDRPEFRARFGPFYVMDILGRGGMGIVFKAHDPTLQRTVAVKVLAPQLATSETARKRFLREARAAARVVDDHVVTIHSVNEVYGFPFLVMQFIEGESLESRLRRAGAMGGAEAIRVAEETAKGLRAAHNAGLIHRDIKPANILLEASTGRCKITDFGLARAVEDETLTRTGLIAGTPHYMAPEQALGEAVDHRTDLYSLGAVLFCVCTGEPPYDGKTPLSVLSKVVEGTVPEVRKSNSAVPTWLEEVISRLMAKNPDDRYQSADELLVRLEERDATPGTVRRRTSIHRALAACLGVVVVLLVAVFAVPWDGGSGTSSSDVVIDAGNDRPAGAVLSDFRILHPDDTIETAGNLSEALTLARDGSTIEIAKSGQIEVAGPLGTQGKALVMRAAAGATPIIIMTRNGASGGAARLTTSAPLALEGIEFRYPEAGSAPATPDCLILAKSGPLYITNCHFSVPDLPGSRISCLNLGGTIAVIQNSLFTCGPMGTGIFSPVDHATQIDVENCAFLADNALTLAPGLAGRSGQGEAVRMRCSTVIGQCAVHLLGREAKPGQGHTALGIRVEQCLFDLEFLCTATSGRNSDPVRAETIALDRLMGGIQWSGAGNVFSIGRSYCGFSLGPRSYGMARSGPRSLISWQDFCHEEADSSREAKVFFPDAPAGARPQPGDSISAAGFRFVLDRLGSRPPGTSQVGASVDTLGPGSAYETWRRSPAVGQWASRWKEALNERSASEISRKR